MCHKALCDVRSHLLAHWVRSNKVDLTFWCLGWPRTGGKFGPEKSLTNKFPVQIRIHTGDPLHAKNPFRGRSFLTKFVNNFAQQKLKFSKGQISNPKTVILDELAKWTNDSGFCLIFWFLSKTFSGPKAFQDFAAPKFRFATFFVYWKGSLPKTN